MYHFSYQGELVEGADKANVIENLARIFSISETQAAQLFEPDKEFFRDGLDQSTAHDYLMLFSKAGAKGSVHASKPESKVKNGEVDSSVGLIRNGDGGKEGIGREEQAPKIDQKMRPRGDVQVEYGAQVMKHLEAEGSANRQNFGPESSEEPIKRRKPKPNHLQNNVKSAAARWLRIGGLAVVITMIADNQLQSMLIIDRFGFDMGYWPLVIAHIPLVIGCYLLAQEKRLSPIFRLFGLLSFAGLSLLLLMPAKGARDHKIGIGAMAMTVFSCGVFIYWFGGALQTSVDTQGLRDSLTSLRDGREEFPSSLRQGQLALYSSEQSELYQAVTDIITLANSDTLRPDQATELSNAMMNEVARYIAWRQYQKFLHRTNDKTLPEGLESEFQEGDERKIGGLLRGVTPQSNKRLYEAVASWTVAPVDENEYAKTIQLRRQLDKIYDAVRDRWLAQTGNSRSGKAESQVSGRPPAINVALLKLPDLSGAELVKRKNHVEYVFTAGPLTGKTLAVGFYTVKNKPRWNRKVSYSPKYKLLNSDVPTIYMSNLISVFNRYINPIF